MKIASTLFIASTVILIAACSGNIQETNLAKKAPNPNGRNDGWGFVGYGGGGAMFDPAVSPHDPD